MNQHGMGYLPKLVSTTIKFKILLREARFPRGQQFLKNPVGRRVAK